MSSRLTAMEIESQRFARKLRGYDPSDVDLFLRSVSEEVQRLSIENGQLREESGRLKQELQGVRSREESLQRTLVTAQRMTDEMRDRAGKESELLVREARLRADGMLKEAQDRLARLDSDISRSKLERDTFERRLRGVLEQHLALLDMRRDAFPEGDNLRVLPDRTRSEAG